MNRLRFEEDPHDRSPLVCLVLGSIAAVAGCLWAGWVAGCFGFLLVGSLVLVMMEGYRNAAITPETIKAAELAMAVSKQKYPDEAHGEILVCSIEPDRHTFSIHYPRGLFSLSFRRYFSVTWTDPPTVEEARSPYEVPKVE